MNQSIFLTTVLPLAAAKPGPGKVGDKCAVMIKRKDENPTDSLSPEGILRGFHDPESAKQRFASKESPVKKVTP